jgi:hypothetical protein
MLLFDPDLAGGLEGDGTHRARTVSLGERRFRPGG